jgi:hypothetical protein
MLNERDGSTMIEDVIERLASFGYVATEADTWVLKFIIDKTENHIKNSCNISEIPDGLYQVAVDMACGNFLYEKKAVNPDSLAGFDLEVAVKSIQEGDTNVSFALGEGSLTPEQRLDALISYLITYGEKDFVTYRCLKW